MAVGWWPDRGPTVEANRRNSPVIHADRCRVPDCSESERNVRCDLRHIWPLLLWGDVVPSILIGGVGAARGSTLGDLESAAPVRSIGWDLAGDLEGEMPVHAADGDVEDRDTTGLERQGHVDGMVEEEEVADLEADDLAGRRRARAEPGRRHHVRRADVCLHPPVIFGDVERPGPRTTIFSFVVHRTEAGWRCASAQNTDVVPGKETHIVDDTGAFGSVDYRTR